MRLARRIRSATNSMTDPFFVDSNVLIYARDAGTPAKQARAAQWLEFLWRQRAGRMSTQILSEFYVTVTQKLRPGLARTEAREEVGQYLVWQPASVNTETIQRAWSIQDRFSVSWWDSLIVASAQGLGCRYLLTEDLTSGQRLDELEVINPFERLPEDI